MEPRWKTNELNRKRDQPRYPVQTRLSAPCQRERKYGRTGKTKKKKLEGEMEQSDV